MKFEKHLKNCGMFATIFRASTGEMFVACGENGRTFVRCPDGFAPISAANVKDFPDWIDDIILNPEELMTGELFAARVPADGKANDIVRIFADTFDHEFRVEITSADYGLLERRDSLKIYKSDSVNDCDALVVMDLAGVTGIILEIHDMEG